MKLLLSNNKQVGAARGLRGAVSYHSLAAVELYQPGSAWYITSGDMTLCCGQDQWRIDVSRVSVLQQEFFIIGTELLSTSERIDTPHPQGMLPTDTYMIWSVHTEFTHERVVKDPSPLQVNLEKGIYLENETRTNALLIVAHVFPHHLGFSRNMEAIDAYLANCTLRLEGLPFG